MRNGEFDDMDEVQQEIDSWWFDLNEMLYYTRIDTLDWFDEDGNPID